MKQPPFLTVGSKVALVAPSRSTDQQTVDTAAEWFSKQGFQTVYDEGLFATHNQFAGTDDERADYIQRWLDNDEVSALVAMRGGYGAVRVIDKLNFDRFAENPKWFVGYSDATVFHARLQQLGLESIHGTMPINFGENTSEALHSLSATLSGKTIRYEIKADSHNRKGRAEAPVVGGNLSVLYSLLGSSTFPDTDGKILFIEDLDEYLYHIDRMMTALERAHVFDNLAGLVVGGLTQMHDNTVPFGMTAEEIVCEHVSGFGFPVCFGFPAGHFADNRAFVLGRCTRLEVGDSGVVFEQRPQQVSGK